MSNATELDTNQAATVLDVTARQVRYLVASGELKPDRLIKTTKRTYYFFQRETVEALARKRSGEEPPRVDTI